MVLRKSFDLLFVLGIPIGLGLFVLANPLVLLLYGNDFVPSGPILAVLGLALVLTYQNILIGQFLISIDKQSVWTLLLAAAALTTVLLDWFLVPWCQANWGNGGVAHRAGTSGTSSTRRQQQLHSHDRCSRADRNPPAEEYHDRR